ncbi:hypothetical protein TcasGA2_TC034205 [Tribolium castaneum]|uniref:Uncharacterized protein n=1 Tax=Tribolium castaneum TaxID=7070 RepID=A0A139W9H9_TRICA|nr:PREDICTED: uncharacterized protein LOC107398997 [Tribolium castaneum]KYB24580.1 hypothetical protein TcasGA2_TC034205 [Tribolium castaneum]|eukprot:XP_015840119.1 PREDICTED: uncharacterized protein LOC107398997 [Tribolium castaneum]
MKLVRLRIDQLKYVFPIKKVEPKLEVESAESDMVSAIAEASQTMYVRDRWEYADFLTDSSELQYSIVEPTLPGSGNYSLYNIWGNLAYFYHYYLKNVAKSCTIESVNCKIVFPN